MVPRPNLTAEQVAPWFKELAVNPPEPEEYQEARDLTSAQEDPELAFDLGPDGVPRWWPTRHPDYQEGAALSETRRRAWFLGFMADALSPLQGEILDAAPSWRRRMIAQSLLRTQSSFPPVSELPTPDSL